MSSLPFGSDPEWYSTSPTRYSRPQVQHCFISGMSNVPRPILPCTQVSVQFKGRGLSGPAMGLQVRSYRGTRAWLPGPSSASNEDARQPMPNERHPSDCQTIETNEGFHSTCA